MPLSINYDSSRELRIFLEEQGLGMRKKYGQNFLIDREARGRILDALEFQKGDRLWEIGPGLGAMTRGLLDQGARVRAFEIDPGFIRILKELWGERENFILIEGDVLKTWPSGDGGEAYLLGNLPYTIGAALLGDLIEKKRFFKRMVITIQKEVARRMTAGPGNGDYTSLSVLCASAYTIRPVQVLHPSSFYPAPHVNSQALRFDLRTDTDPSAYPVFFYSLVRSLFSSRRKTVKNNLSGFAASLTEGGSRDAAGGSGKKQIREITGEVLTASRISPERRAETLSLEDFLTLARTLEEYYGHY
ncbi:MAG: 16S rRNA (adenine(1518)-N(6)/adenine(1519)-N(6))-dimethyltransferase RsmA [Treponema sp.]|nr:16S rRNA (adenine(1518)-N(6)/adenine(1519)-N(6))-dimethyltransferase RsmA [Treponema sp.]